MRNNFITETVNNLQTIQDMLRWSVSRFCASNIWYGHGTDNSWDEAIQLVLSSLYLPIDISPEMYTARLTSSEKYHIVELVIRRINERIPIAYLINKSWFCGHEFYVDKRVLIPRSPIGELINNRFSGIIHRTPKYILDMCTGCGCIAISCAYVFPKARIHGVDISLDALAVMKKNIKKHGLVNKVIPIQSNLFQNLPNMQYDLIITNPPYVSVKDIFNLPKEYHHEPKISLSAGSDGLQLTDRILSCAMNYLTDDGILICEVGNRMVPLIEKYPNIPFIWLEFENGGDGVFMLSKLQLLNTEKHFQIYKN